MTVFRVGIFASALLFAAPVSAESLLVCEPVVSPDGRFAAMVVEDPADVQGADVVELWLCDQNDCAPVARDDDRGGIRFQWRGQSLQVSTTSRTLEWLAVPEDLRAVPIDLHTVDGRHRSRRPDLISPLQGVGGVGGLTENRCQRQTRAEWPGWGGN